MKHINKIFSLLLALLPAVPLDLCCCRRLPPKQWNDWITPIFPALFAACLPRSCIWVCWHLP